MLSLSTSFKNTHICAHSLLSFVNISDNKNCSRIKVSLSICFTDFYKATQAAVCLAFIFNFGAAIAVGLFVVGQLQKKTKIGSIVFLSLAGKFLLRLPVGTIFRRCY